jgi:hypothetical protein
MVGADVRMLSGVGSEGSLGWFLGLSGGILYIGIQYA